MGQAVIEVGGVLNAGLLLMGERLGLYTTLASCGPLTPEELGTCMPVEPIAGGHIKDNLNPVGRLFYAASTLIRTPCPRSQGGSRPRCSGRRGAPAGRLHEGRP